MRSPASALSGWKRRPASELKAAAGSLGQRGKKLLIAVLRWEALPNAAGLAVPSLDVSLASLPALAAPAGRAAVWLLAAADSDRDPCLSSVSCWSAEGPRGWPPPIQRVVAGLSSQRTLTGRLAQEPGLGWSHRGHVMERSLRGGAVHGPSPGEALESRVWAILSRVEGATLLQWTPRSLLLCCWQPGLSKTSMCSDSTRLCPLLTCCSPGPTPPLPSAPWGFSCVKPPRPLPSWPRLGQSAHSPGNPAGTGELCRGLSAAPGVSGRMDEQQEKEAAPGMGVS